MQMFQTELGLQNTTRLLVLPLGAWGDNPDGLFILNARFFAEELAERSAALPSTPTPELFSLLHEVAVEYHDQQISACIFEGAQAKILEGHRKIIARLQELAKKLGIAYKEPEDPLLK